MQLNIVLVEPEIPANTGNIARTCACTGARLHIVRPIPFSLDEKHLRRAGLDYWKYLDVTLYDDLDDFFAKNPDGPYYYFTTKALQKHSDVEYPDKAYLMFGKETAGLPEALLKAHPERCVRIPMLDECRSLNLSNSVAIGVYETLRQWDYPELQSKGQLHDLVWTDGDADIVNRGIPKK